MTVVLQDESRQCELDIDTFSVDLHDLDDSSSSVQSTDIPERDIQQHSHVNEMMKPEDLNVSSCTTSSSTTCPPLAPPDDDHDGEERRISPRSVVNPNMPLPYKPTRHATQREGAIPNEKEEMPFDCGPGGQPRKRIGTISSLSKSSCRTGIGSASPLKSTSFRQRRMQLAQQRKWKEEHLGKLVETKIKPIGESSSCTGSKSNNSNGNSNSRVSPEKPPLGLVGQERILSPSSLSFQEEGNMEVSLGAHLGRFESYSSSIPVSQTTESEYDDDGRGGEGGGVTPLEVSSRLEYSDSQDAIPTLLSPSGGDVYEMNNIPLPSSSTELDDHADNDDEDQDSMTIDTVSSLNSSQSERTRGSSRHRYRPSRLRKSTTRSLSRKSKSSKSRERRERELDYEGVHPPMYVSSVKKKVKRKSQKEGSNSERREGRSLLSPTNEQQGSGDSITHKSLSPQTDAEIESILKHGTSKSVAGSSPSRLLTKKGRSRGLISPNASSSNLDVTRVISNHGGGGGGGAGGVETNKGIVVPSNYTSTPSASTTSVTSSLAQETPFKELPFSPILSISPTDTPYVPSPPSRMMESPSEPPSLTAKAPVVKPVASSPSMSEPPSLTTQERLSPTGTSGNSSQPPSLRKDRTEEEKEESPTQPPSLSKTNSKHLPPTSPSSTILKEPCPSSPTLKTEMPGSNCPKTLQRRRMQMYLSKRGTFQLRHPEQNGSKELDSSKEEEEHLQPEMMIEEHKEIDPNLTTDQTHMERQFDTDVDLLPDQILVSIQEAIPEELDAKSTTSYRTCRTCLSTKPSNPKDLERALKLKKRQIYLFHHALTCSHPPSLVPQYDSNGHVSSFAVEESYKPCPQVRNCYALSILVKHVQTCTVLNCPVPKCRAYKKVWNHYRRCIGRTFTMDETRKKCRLCCDLWESSRRDFDDSDDEQQ